MGDVRATQECFVTILFGCEMAMEMEERHVVVVEEEEEEEEESMMVEDM
jgi:hypothetical protein